MVGAGEEETWAIGEGLMQGALNFFFSSSMLCTTLMLPIIYVYPRFIVYLPFVLTCGLDYHIIIRSIL